MVLSFEVNNELGYYSFFFILVLVILYFMKPKPIKKTVPSIIFLEKNDRKNKFFLFFKRFIKDWLFLIQLFLIVLLCLAILDLSTEIFVKKINEEVVFVIDASASSQTIFNNKILFDYYKDIAKKRLGLSNSIVLAKNSPEVIAKQVNIVSANNIINNLKPSDSLSNIYDSMIIASNLIQKGKIIVVSDFIDTNNKDILTAKNIIEAKGLNVELLNPRFEQQEHFLDNVGIIDYKLNGNLLELEIKNFGNNEKEIRIDDKKILIKPFSIIKYNLNLESDKNKITIETNDNFKVDDILYVSLPKKSDNSILFITNQKKSFIKSAFESMPFVSLKIQEPPIVNFGNEKIIVLNNVNYDNLLPGTIEKIKENVEKGSTLIIAAQEKIDTNKLEDLLPLSLDLQNQEIIIYNNNNVPELKDFQFGLSNKYFKSELINNNSIIIAEANDKFRSPIIVLTKYGKGNILFYGIFDNNNQFKNSPQYPLFWIQVLNLINSKNFKLNYKISETIYGNKIVDPNGKIFENYLTLEKTGFYKLDDIEIAVNLLNTFESDINQIKIMNSDYSSLNVEKSKEKISLFYVFVILAILVSFFELYILKRRGDL
ncbi:MAG: BatA domain-containing protein [Candidatus Woesearchaeota archaeon]